MTSQNNINIKQILGKIPANTVITAKKLHEEGVSHSLMRFYEKSGWLTRLSNGAYTRLNETANLTGALYALQNDCKISVHIGADSVLRDFYGKLHFVKAEVKSRLFAPSGTKLPVWFKKSYENQFELYCSDFLPQMLGLTDFQNATFSVKIPTVERALLELLYLVPNSVTVQEAYSITETVRTVKPFVMQRLLEQCSSVKVKRLLLCFAEHAGLQWFDVLDAQKINLGSGVRTLESGGTLYAKYSLVMKELD